MSNSDVEQLRSIVQDRVKGKWVPEHDEDGHHYRNQETGTLVDSVTTKNIIEKPHLIRWASRLSAEYMAEKGDWLGEDADSGTVKQMIKDASLAYRKERDGAASIGTAAHNALESYVNAGMEGEVTDYLESDNNQAIAAARSGAKALREEGIQPIAAEMIVGSEDVGVAGTLDLLCLWDNELLIVDWKTSNSISDNYAMQIATYAGLFEEMANIGVDGCKIIKLSKKSAKYKVFELKYPNRAYAAAKRLYKVADYLEADYKKLQKRGNKAITI